MFSLPKTSENVDKQGVRHFNEAYPVRKPSGTFDNVLLCMKLKQKIQLSSISWID